MTELGKARGDRSSWVLVPVGTVPPLLGVLLLLLLLLSILLAIVRFGKGMLVAGAIAVEKGLALPVDDTVPSLVAVVVSNPKGSLDDGGFILAAHPPRSDSCWNVCNVQNAMFI